MGFARGHESRASLTGRHRRDSRNIDARYYVTNAGDATISELFFYLSLFSCPVAASIAVNNNIIQMPIVHGPQDEGSKWTKLSHRLHGGSPLQVPLQSHQVTIGRAQAQGHLQRQGRGCRGAGPPEPSRRLHNLPCLARNVGQLCLHLGGGVAGQSTTRLVQVIHETRRLPLHHSPAASRAH